MGWVVVAGVLLVAEVFTLTFFLGVMAVGALAGAGAALLGAPLALQLLAAGGTAAVGALGVRPLAARQRRALPSGTRMGMDALTDARGVVLARVDAHGGLVKLRGEEWSARAYDPAQVIEPGTPVAVSAIDGATAVVYPSPDPGGPAWTV